MAATVSLLDQDFGSESEDDAPFNPAPGEESDNEIDREDNDEADESDQQAAGRRRSGSPQDARDGDQSEASPAPEPTINKANGHRKKSTTPAADKNLDEDDESESNTKKGADDEDEEEPAGDEDEEDEEDDDEDEDEDEDEEEVKVSML